MEIFTKWNRGKKVVSQSKKGGAYNQIAYTRRGTDYIEANGSSAGERKKIPTKWVTARDGSKYEIPYDPKTGKVPEEYLFGRFLMYWTGSRNGHERDPRRDIGIDAEIIHEMPDDGFTPEQLVESGWWQYPNESDIMGIDDTGATAFAKLIEEAAKSAQGAGKEIICLMPPESQARVKKILAKDFTATELNKAVKHGGIIIKEGNPGPGNAGCYYPRFETSSLKIPVIILKKGWSEETLVHEFIHHLRHVDETRGGLTRTPMKLNADGERRSSMSYGSVNEFNSATNLEEAATVAESYARSQEIVSTTGYYNRTHAHGETAEQRSRHDRNTLVPAGATPKRGRRAERHTTENFDKLSISGLSYYRPGSNAGNYYAKRKAEGSLPVAVKPTRKKTGDVTKAGGVTGGTRGTATASKNKLPAYRRRK